MATPVSPIPRVTGDEAIRFVEAEEQQSVMRTRWNRNGGAIKI